MRLFTFLDTLRINLRNRAGTKLFNNITDILYDDIIRDDINDRPEFAFFTQTVSNQFTPWITYPFQITYPFHIHGDREENYFVDFDESFGKNNYFKISKTEKQNSENRLHEHLSTIKFLKIEHPEFIQLLRNGGRA